MARRSAAATATMQATVPSAKASRNILAGLRTVWNWTVGVCLLLFGVWGAFEVERILVTDKRFILEGPPEPGVQGGPFRVEGVTYASESRIVDIFRRDFGRSIYLCPIKERRLNLMGIDWVKEASVSRVWPNRLLVRVTERKPVAFVQMPAADGAMMYGLVDADGIMLDPQRAAKLTLPVLAGVATDEGKRKQQILRFTRMQTDMGPLMESVSEVDVTDTNNLRVVTAVNGRAITLMLGDRDFLQRYRKFHDKRGEILQLVPNAKVLDLRMKTRFTAVVTEEPPAEELKQ